ncbi:hypothetical protein THRCLA_23082 [Thraustotheca clavata]|uniref:Uncharacterized protein n=1 Tax=Thraustotheca clavata TaxID=74557 RepID=A0A1V9YF61_9STRA|nr:hypothetical protein THRCLA_23082 [Thraustotheca clavata]
MLNSFYKSFDICLTSKLKKRTLIEMLWTTQALAPMSADVVLSIGSGSTHWNSGGNNSIETKRHSRICADLVLRYQSFLLVEW